MNRTLACLAGCWMVGASALAQAQAPSICGPLQNAFGPLDYRSAPPATRSLVEDAHFTPPVQALIAGHTSRRPGGDIDYTLRAFPNNPRALLAVIRLGEQEKTDKPSGMRYTVECWLERAARFQPNDVIVRMIRAGYFAKRSRKEEALRELQFAEQFADPENPLTAFNIGMGYFDAGDHAQALRFAHKALAMGLAWPDLRKRLQAVGQWVEPPDAAASSPLPAASSASASGS